jgi:3-dehydroquinate dehydratase-1
MYAPSVKARGCTRPGSFSRTITSAIRPAPDFLVQRFLEAERLGADVAKVRVMPRDRGDVLALLAATNEANGKARIPLISMSMGPLGSVTRMIGGRVRLVAVVRRGEGSSAPGQIPIADLNAVYDVIRRATR